MFKSDQSESPVKGAYTCVIKTLIDLVFIAFCTGLSMFYLLSAISQNSLSGEIVLPLLVLSAIGWLLYLILRITLKASRKAALLSVLSWLLWQTPACW